MLNNLEYDRSMEVILNPDECISLSRNGTSHIKTKVYKLMFSEVYEVCRAKTRTQLTPYLSKVLLVCCLSKIHKRGIPFAPRVSLYGLGSDQFINYRYSYSPLLVL